MRSAAMLVGFLLTGADAAPVPKDFRKPDDKTRLIGTWAISRANENGKETPRFEPWHTLTFRADGVLVFKYPDGSPDQQAEWVIDPTAVPKRLAEVWTEGAALNFNVAYQFRDGRLVMAWTQDGTPPKSVDPGPNVKVIEYKRAEGK